MLVFGSMFSGVGLLDSGLHLAGIRHTWFCERDEWRRGILAQRWPGSLILDDARAVGVDSVPRVDGIVGGFPCKGISGAGKREGFRHPETVLWREMARAVRELRPRYVVVENVADILAIHDGAVWAEVLGDLAALGFDVEWDVLPAAAVGAPHLRQRVLAVATHADSVAGSPRVALSGRSGPVGESGPVERAVGLHGAPTASADAAWDAEGGPAAVSGADGERVGAGADAPADANEPRADPHATPGGPRSPIGERDRGLAVEWGEYEPAIRRWEAIHGPVPEPLVRRLDDGDRNLRRLRARVDRSRLSALGDGVQVQVGYLVGRYIIEFERRRVMREAA